MSGYIVCFSLTIFFAYISEILLKNDKNKTLGKYMLLISLLVVCIIAGVRNTNVGIDINVYVSRLIRWFNEENVIANTTVSEPLFNLLVFWANKIGGIHFVLFCIEFCVAAPVYLWTYLNRDKYSITLVISVFLLTMFAKSLNLMRQFIAISFLLLSVFFYEKNNKKICLILYVIAMLFHYTAFIGILFFAIQNIIKNDNNTIRSKIIQIVSILILIILGLIFFEKIVVLLPEKYSSYLNSSYVNVSNSISINSFIKKVFWIVLGIIVYLSTSKKDNIFLLSIVYLIIDLLLFFSSAKIKPAGRLGYYFLYIGYFYFFANFVKKFKQRKVIYVLTIMVLTVLWYHMTVINYKADATFPYTSSIINILN